MLYFCQITKAIYFNVVLSPPPQKALRKTKYLQTKKNQLTWEGLLQYFCDF